MAKKRFMVVGLGILGETVARTLALEGAEVIALDMDPVYIERIKDTTAMAVQGDSTDPKLLAQLGVEKLDAVIVCIGENFPGALMTTVQLLDLKVKHVAVRATTELHANLLRRLGAHDVFFVESEMGKAIAHRLATPGILHEMDLGEGFRIVESSARPWMIGKNIAELALPKNYAVQIIAMRDSALSNTLVMPKADIAIQKSYNLLLVGRDRDLLRLMED